MLFIFFTVISTVVLMECFAWFSHKYIMHGFMWSWHQSHHSKQPQVLEKNDLFGLIFALFSAGFIIWGSLNYTNIPTLFWIGIGIMVYGFLYFIFHDVIVHKRINNNFKAKNQYLKRIIKAHHIHHKYFTKEGSEAFGFLFATKKYNSKHK